MRKVCQSLECHSTAVAKSIDTGQELCLMCSIKIVKQNGPRSMVSLGDSSILPWEGCDDSEIGVCENCGTQYTHYLIGHTGDCPKCRRPLPKEVLNGTKN